MRRDYLVLGVIALAASNAIGRAIAFDGEDLGKSIGHWSLSLAHWIWFAAFLITLVCVGQAFAMLAERRWKAAIKALGLAATQPVGLAICILIDPDPLAILYF